jgi:hypothetical protein
LIDGENGWKGERLEVGVGRNAIGSVRVDVDDIHRAVAWVLECDKKRKQVR